MTIASSIAKAVASSMLGSLLPEAVGRSAGDLVMELADASGFTLSPEALVGLVLRETYPSGRNLENE